MLRVNHLTGFNRRRGGGGDPHFSSVQLLLHMEGTDDAQVFTDSSQNGFTVTANGNVKTENTEKKFGSTSAYFDGSGDYLSIADHANLRIGTSDFTLEWWIRYAAGGAFQSIYTKGYATTGGLLLQTTNGANPALYNYFGSTSIFTESGSPALNTWYHHAVVRDSGTVTLYRDGVSVGSASNSTDLNDTSAIDIGNGGGYGFNGYLDELRLTIGVARYTGAFTPPTEAFPDS